MMSIVCSRKLLVVFALLALSSPAAAQTEQLTPGARIRVSVSGPPLRTQVARFEQLTDSALVTSGNVVIPITSITRLELSRGRKLNVVGGAVGSIVGIAVGAAIACDANRDSYGVFCGGQNDTKVAVGAGIGGVAGAVLGAFLFRRDRWMPVNLQRVHND